MLPIAVVPFVFALAGAVDFAFISRFATCVVWLPALPDNGHTATRQVANKLANRVLTPFLIVGWVVMTTSRAVSTATTPASVAPKKIKTVLPTGTRDHKIPLVQVILQHFEVCSPADFDATPAARQRGDRIWLMISYGISPPIAAGRSHPQTREAGQPRAPP